MSRDPFDPKKALERFHASSRGLVISGVDDTIIAYRKKRRQRTLVIKATWRHVLVYAFVNAIAVSTAKEFIYQIFGKPVLLASEEAETDR
jgi:hypothetical protein